MNRIIRGTLVVATALLAVGCMTAPRVFADADEEGENAPGLLPQVTAAKVTLEQGLAAAESSGKPLSAKFEIEDGKLQLSVYTKKDNKYFEVVVDHETGAVSKTEEIKGGNDLRAAQRQSRAIQLALRPSELLDPAGVKGCRVCVRCGREHESRERNHAIHHNLPATS